MHEISSDMVHRIKYDSWRSKFESPDTCIDDVGNHFRHDLTIGFSPLIFLLLSPKFGMNSPDGNTCVDLISLQKT